MFGKINTIEPRIMKTPEMSYNPAVSIRTTLGVGDGSRRNVQFPYFWPNYPNLMGRMARKAPEEGLPTRKMVGNRFYPMHPDPKRNGRTGMTRFVLVPGAWLGAWAWKKVVPLLEERGNEAHAVTLTGLGERVHLASKDVGIETAIQDVLSVIKYNDLDDFVLVGHSFAGKVVAAVADHVPEKVKMILYLDAFRPEKNVRTPQGSFDPNEFGSLKPGEWTIPLTEEILDNIGKDVQGADREWMLSMATPWPMKHSSQPVTLSNNFDSVRSAYIFCTGGGDPVDEILKGKWGKLDGPYKVIESGHWPMVTKPDELVEDMLALAGK